MANEEQMSRVPLPDELLAIIAQRYGLSLGQARQLDGGDECLVWSVPSHQGPLVVRSSPCWRSPERLAWTHRLMLSLQAVLPQVIAPLRALDGSTLFRYNNRSVALIPYVAGAPFDRENPKLRQEAATFLARLHATLLNRAPDSAGLQHHLLIGAPPLPPAPDPDSLIDLELDIWHTTVLQKSASFSTGLIHGDYYRRNLLTEEEQIITLLYFDDLHLDFLMQEIAWSSWEFCKTGASDDWHLDRVQAFLRSYREAGGPCKAEEYLAFIPFIRWRLRQELRRHFAMVAHGLPGEPEYAARQLRAFERLRDCHVSFA